MSDTALKAGDTATLTFTFSEAVTGFTSAADPTLSKFGTLQALPAATAALPGPAPTPTLLFESATNLISLDTGLTDLAGNIGSGSQSANYGIDTLRPSLQNAISLSDSALKLATPPPSPFYL